MSVSTTTDRDFPVAQPPRRVRLGARRADGAGVEWLLKRNCSIAPRQMLSAYVALSVLSLGIAGFFWSHGATLVMPFAWLEIVALGAAIVVHGRHVGDREHIECADGRVTVELTDGSCVDRVEFLAGSVRVESPRASAPLIRLSGRGRSVEVGRHLRPEWRPVLAEELREALRVR